MGRRLGATHASRFPIAAIGADIGGTWIRVQALDASGRKVRSLKRPAPLPERLPSFLKEIFRRWKARPVYLAVASRGVWTAAERRRMAGLLRGLARRTAVLSDVEAAWLAAFSPEGRPRASHKKLSRGGILVIAGTGSIAFGRDSDGRSGRAGGLGPLLGDEGSAFWVGREHLKMEAAEKLHRVLRHLSVSSAPVRRIAALAAGILRRARGGDPDARRILARAQEHLAALVSDLCRELRFEKTVPVSWAGGMLADDEFRKGFQRAVEKITGRPVEWTAPRLDGATAAARSLLFPTKNGGKLP